MIYNVQNINNDYCPALSETFGVHSFLEGGTERCGWVIRSPLLYLGGHGSQFESRDGLSYVTTNYN
jgi:hypothetical protein